MKLQDFALYCPEDLTPGATLVFDGRHWRIGKVECCDGGTSTDSEVIKQLLERITNLDKAMKELEKALDVSFEWYRVEFNGETEKVKEDPSIKGASILNYSFLNGDTAGHVTTYVEDGRLIIRSEAPETGTFEVLIMNRK